MLIRWLIAALIATSLPLTLASRASADDHTCPVGTQPVFTLGGTICATANDPGAPSSPGTPHDPESGSTHPAGCFRNDGTEVPCKTSDGTWWPGHQCYATPSNAPPGDPAWQGHTNGTVWNCSSCVDAANSSTCHVQVVWLPPGVQPGPPTPGELAAFAVGGLTLAKAKVHTAPAAPDHTYIGVENWLWVPVAQWATLSRRVTAGATTVTVTAAPSQVVWDMGTSSETCYSAGSPWHRGMTDSATTSCGYTYGHASESQPHGVYAITATIRYQVDWTCRGTCTTAAGSLGLVDAPAGAGTMRVLQRQTVVIR